MEQIISQSGFQDGPPSARPLSNAKKAERGSGGGGTRYVLSNLNLKKGLNFGKDDYKQQKIPGDSHESKKLSEKGTYSGLIKVKNTDPKVKGDYQYVDINEWWKTHRNILKREKQDMAPISYDKDCNNPWDWITTALTQENADEAKQYRSEIKFLLNGQ